MLLHGDMSSTEPGWLGMSSSEDEKTRYSAHLFYDLWLFKYLKQMSKRCHCSSSVSQSHSSHKPFVADPLSTDSISSYSRGKNSLTEMLSMLYFFPMDVHVRGNAVQHHVQSLPQASKTHLLAARVL